MPLISKLKNKMDIITRELLEFKIDEAVEYSLHEWYNDSIVIQLHSYKWEVKYKSKKRPRYILFVSRELETEKDLFLEFKINCADGLFYVYQQL